LGWATAISQGPANEASQQVHFVVQQVSRPELFAALPAIDLAGQLTFTPQANAGGSADVMVVLVDDGGTANGGIDTSLPQTFTITVTKIHPWHNAAGALDVSLDGHVAPEDALAVIDFINASGAGPVPIVSTWGPPYLDTNGDGFVSPSDALAIINAINAARPGGEGEARARGLASGLGDSRSSSFTDSDMFALLAADIAAQQSQASKLSQTGQIRLGD
jgi:hypothetical protein